MKKIFQQIWDLALPYQDKRDDTGHAVISLYYAQELVPLENGDEDIIIPAIILHDIGYSQLTRERRLLSTDRTAKEEDKKSVALEHQNAGVELARGILSQVGYPSDLTAEILEIISQHDTREGFISRNEGLTRDADKLWRFSKINFAAASSRDSDFKRELLCKKLEEDMQKPVYLYSQQAKRIALEELELRKKAH